MAMLPIRTYPDPVLLKPGERVVSVDDDVRRLLADMAETMYASNGIGLAAPQVGVSLRVSTIDVPADDEDGEPGLGLIYLVNPEIIERDGASVHREGCLSFPELEVDVKRWARVKVRFLDDRGESRELDATGLLAVCIQHELDHLDGVTMVDRLGPVSRRLALREYQKLMADAAKERE